MAVAVTASDGSVRRKYGKSLELLSAGWPEEGEMIGTCASAATCAAVNGASEHPAPMIAFTPRLLNASLV
eukprot:5179622-Prymnesium_polylepis.2